MVEKMTKEQKGFLDAEGRVVIKACPGSGKTYVVAHKLLSYVDNWKDYHSGVAVLSFTNVASNEIYEKASIYHLRGGIDYSKLNFAHKTMMSLLYKKAKGLPEEKKTAEVKAMIDTYNQKVNFVDFSSLESIIKEI